MLSACGKATDTPDTPEPASLVVSGAAIWTGNPEQPWAQAIASRGEYIVAIGSRADMDPFIGAGTEIIDANGAMLLPGFIDTHVHFADGGSSLASVQLRDAKTPEEFTRRIGEFAKTVKPGEWPLDGNWDHENWGGKLPTKEWIDAVTPDNPVWIARLDGHMALANSLALKMAGVDADTRDIAGGEIVRDANGYPTGILKDNA
ncbi:MAG: amidohydrolase family protein, partial [Halioglobus sp.]|nr:amidohydrolase family protein [Halioglobus sp.]